MASINYLDESIDTLLAQASSEDKPIFLHFWSSSCYWSSFEDQNLEDAEVTDYLNAHFLSKKVVLQDESGSADFARFGVNSTPTLLIVNADETVLAKFTGALSWSSTAYTSIHEALGNIVNNLAFTPNVRNDGLLLGSVADDLLNVPAIAYGDGDWGTAINEAKSAGKMLYYCFWDSAYSRTSGSYTSHPSEMGKYLYWEMGSNATERAYIEDYAVRYAVDIRSEQGPAIFNYFGVKEFNTYMFTKNTGEPVLTMAGGAESFASQRDQLLAYLNKAVLKETIEPVVGALTGLLTAVPD